MQTLQALRAWGLCLVAGVAAAHGNEAPIDTTPPALVAFNAHTQANARKTGGQAVFDLTITDDLIGAQSVAVYLVGPSGQSASANSFGSVPQRRWRLHMAMPLDVGYEPGVWRVWGVYMTDALGNLATVYSADLQKLGNTEVLVTNRSYDVTAPTLESGKVMTPSVSMSDTPKGAPPGSMAPFLKVVVKVRDSGGELVSGGHDAYAEFCLPMDQGGCWWSFRLYSPYQESVWGDDLAVFDLGGGVDYNLPPAVYHLRQVYMTDNAGNQRMLNAKEYGGETDFSLYFPSTTIEIRP